MKKLAAILMFLVPVISSLHAQKIRDPRQQVFVGEQLLSYDAALPLATKMLDGNTNEQKQAVAALKEFGISLKGTQALDKLLKIVEKSDDFSAFDKAVKASPDSKQFLESPVGKSLAALFEIKSDALTAVVMSGSEKRTRLLRDYLSSKSLAYRLMAEDASKAQAKDETWNRGALSTKQQPKLFSYNGQSLAKSEYVKSIGQALDAKASDKMHLAITSLSAANNASAIKDTDVFDRLFSIFVETASNPNEADRKIRLSIIGIVNRSGDNRTSEFMKAAADDKDEIVRDEAGALLQ